MNDKPENPRCQLCGLVIRDSDHVVEVESFDPPIVHVACAESGHIAGSEWNHTDVQTLTQWSRGIGWGSSA